MKTINTWYITLVGIFFLLGISGVIKGFIDNDDIEVFVGAYVMFVLPFACYFEWKRIVKK